MTKKEWLDQTPWLETEATTETATILELLSGSDDEASTPHDEMVAQIQSQENWLMDF